MVAVTRKRPHESPLQPEFWIKATAKTFFLPIDELMAMHGDKQTREIRLAAMWIARNMTGLPYTALARAFGKDDHTTIMNGVRRAESDVRIAGLVEEVLEYVEAGMPE